MSDIRYRPEIDGLRAVAIIPVLLFHLGCTWVPGGYLGVDVFFVISGFLITSILSREMESGQFSFARFWGRRIRRILPALLFVTVTTLVASWWIAFPPDRVNIGRQATATLLSIANVYFWRHAGNYWGGEAENSPFLHAWSLAVEEQFYVLFPPLLYLLHRWTRWRGVTWGLVAVIAASGLFFLYGVEIRPAATFYLLPTRTWELAIGGLLAILLRASPEGPASSVATMITGAFAVMALVASYFLVVSFSAWAVVPVIGTAILILCGGHGPVHRVLSHHWLVGIGRVSYSLYLWHWPVIVLARQLEPPPPAIAIATVFSTLAAISYFVVEEPIRRRPGVMPGLGVALLCGLAIAIATAVTPPAAIDTSLFVALPEYSTAYGLTPRDAPADDWAQLHPASIPQPRIAAADAYRNQGLVFGASDASPRVVVLGDSHGMVWAHAIRLACEEASLGVSVFCMGGVRPFIEFPPSRHQHVHLLTSIEKYDFDMARIEHLERWNPDVVFICTRWSITAPGSADPLLAFLDRHAKRTVLVEQPPELTFAARHGVARLAAFRGIRPREGERQYWPAGNVKAYEAGRSAMQASAKKVDRCVVMPIRDLYADGNGVWFLDGRSCLYLDDNHLTTHGTLIALPRIRDMLSPPVRPTSED